MLVIRIWKQELIWLLSSRMEESCGDGTRSLVVMVSWLWWWLPKAMDVTELHRVMPLSLPHTTKCTHNCWNLNKYYSLYQWWWKITNKVSAIQSKQCVNRTMYYDCVEGHLIPTKYSFLFFSSNQNSDFNSVTSLANFKNIYIYILLNFLEVEWLMKCKKKLWIVTSGKTIVPLLFTFSFFWPLMKMWGPDLWR